MSSTPPSQRQDIQSSSDKPLSPVAHDDVVRALAYALRFDDRGRSHRHAGELTARIAAETLARYLDQVGFVIMRRPATEPHGRNEADG